MSSSSSTVFRMYKKMKRFSEPNKIIVDGLKIAASVNLVAANEDSEEALTFISEVVSTATSTGEFIEGTIIVPSGPLTNCGESDAENLAGSQNYFYYAKIQEGKLLLQFRGGLYPESNANLYDERFVGGGINLRVGEYEWSSEYLPAKVLVPSSWLLEASIGENNIVRMEKGESEEGTASATLDEIEQETSRTAGKTDDVLSLVTKHIYWDLDKNPYLIRDKPDAQTRADGLMIINRLANSDRKQYLFMRDMEFSGERILELLRVEYNEGNRENSRFKDAKLWLHLRDLLCMSNSKMRERIFRLNFSHTRPAELSIMHLQSEMLDTTTFRKGCSIVGKSIICRCLEKLEVVLRCVYSEEYANVTSALRDRIEGQEMSSTTNGFISNQIDKKLECVGRDLGTREFRDFRCVKITPQKCSGPRECAELLERALAEISFSYAEERIYDDNVVTGVITYENTKNNTIGNQSDRKTNDTEHSDVKKSRSALKRAAAKKPVATGLGANISALTSVKLEGYGTTGLHSKSPGPKAINAVTSSSNTVCFFALATAAHFSVTRPDGSIVDFACRRSPCSMRHPALCDITQGEAIQVCEKFKGPNGQALADHIKGLPGTSFKV